MKLRNRTFNFSKGSTHRVKKTVQGSLSMQAILVSGLTGFLFWCSSLSHCVNWAWRIFFLEGNQARSVTGGGGGVDQKLGSDLKSMAASCWVSTRWCQQHRNHFVLYIRNYINVPLVCWRGFYPLKFSNVCWVCFSPGRRSGHFPAGRCLSTCWNDMTFFLCTSAGSLPSK